LKNKKILITGATGTVARPVAEALARDNEVWCLGRFGDGEVKAALQAQGINLLYWDLGVSGLDGLPGGFTHVFHSAVIKNGEDQATHIDKHAFATAQLMHHCRGAEAFTFISASSVYRRQEPGRRHREEDHLGDNTPVLETYCMHKNGAEAVVRALSRLYGLRSTIARLSVTYGALGYGGLPSTFLGLMLEGKPVPARASPDENWCNPLHEDDFIRQAPLLWDVAAVPATVVNWGGDEAVTQRQIAEYVSEITGVPVRFELNERHRMSCAFDNTRRMALIGACEVPWREGVRRSLEARFPDVVKS
jgi:UDP-glucuronate 4-epimerase